MAKPGPRTTYRYSREFKATAVRLSQISGVAVGDVAESLYIHPLIEQPGHPQFKLESKLDAKLEASHRLRSITQMDSSENSRRTPFPAPQTALRKQGKGQRQGAEVLKFESWLSTCHQVTQARCLPGTSGRFKISGLDASTRHTESALAAHHP